MEIIYNLYFIIKKYTKITRTFFWSFFCAIGKNTLLEKGVKIIRPKMVEIGNNVNIAKHTYIEGGSKKIKIGNNVSIGRDCILIGGFEDLVIGDNSSLNIGCYIGSEGKVQIGRYVMFGPKCSIITARHGFSDWSQPMCRQSDRYDPVIIEDDVRLGINTVVLGGVTIGRGAIVGANSVVTKNVEPFSIVGGVPAKLIKYRFSQEDIEKAKKVNLDQVFE